jgi:osomolarity two-component system sensor histidine kinase SLN1
MRDRVFEPFVQGDLGLSKKYGGTGLGLSICSQLANLMGGSIVLESEEGVGSTFTMKIPLKHTKSRAPSTSSSDAHVSRPNSVYSNGDVNQNRISSKRAVDKNIENDSQPRLVGLSQPFFASNPAPSSGTAGKRSDEQLAALDSVTAEKEPGTVNVSSCLAHFRAFNICLKPSLTR